MSVGRTSFVPDPTRSHLYDAILVWICTGNAADGSFAVAATPIEVRGQWVDGQSQALDPQGNTIPIDAKVITTAEVPIGSKMWHGSAADYAALGATTDRQLMEVKTKNNTPDLRHRWTARTLGLIRLGTGV